MVCSCGVELATMADQRHGLCCACRDKKWDLLKQEKLRAETLLQQGLTAFPIDDLVGELVRRGWEQKTAACGQVFLIAPEG